MAIYDSSGAINVTIVDGSTRTGLYAADGSWNVAVAPGGSYVGSVHPCGALYVTVWNGSSVVGRMAPDGSSYVTETLTGNPGALKVKVVSGSFGADVTAPTITTSASLSIPENSAFSQQLTASESVTWTKTGGADSALFTLTSGGLLTMTAKDFEIPADADANNTYVVQVTATDTAGNPTAKTITVTVTDIDEVAPTITSSATVSQPENAALSYSLTASEAVTWSITGGADAALFGIAGSALSLAAKNFEAPVDADSNNTYVVQVTATDTAGNATNQTITVTITDVFEGGGTAGQPVGLLLILTKAA